MEIKSHDFTKLDGRYNITLKCPYCGHNGTFLAINVEALDFRIRNGEVNIGLGQRMCPNFACLGHIFFIYDAKENKLMATYPPIKIDFSRDNFPVKVLSVFEEAIVCHANYCYVASAIMIRRTLEEVCNERGATGRNLFERIQALKNIVIIPIELLEALDHLRLLGNDAAHIEAETYNQVGKEEVEISIELTKELLKALYQYDALLSKIRSLYKSSS